MIFIYIILLILILVNFSFYKFENFINNIYYNNSNKSIPINYKEKKLNLNQITLNTILNSNNYKIDKICSDYTDEANCWANNMCMWIYDSKNYKNSYCKKGILFSI